MQETPRLTPHLGLTPTDSKVPTEQVTPADTPVKDEQKTYKSPFKRALENQETEKKKGQESSKVNGKNNQAKETVTTSAFNTRTVFRAQN